MPSRTVAEQDATLHEYLTTEARRPFDLARGPVLRTSLVHLALDDHVLLLVMHHIAFAA